MGKEVFIRIRNRNTFRILRIPKVCYLLLLLLLNNGCKKEKAEVDSLNFGTIYGQGSEMDVEGAVKTAENDYVLWGNAALTEHGKAGGFVMKVNEWFQLKWYRNVLGFDHISDVTLDDQDNMMVTGKLGMDVVIQYLDNGGNTLKTSILQFPDSFNTGSTVYSAERIIFNKNKGSFYVAGVLGDAMPGGVFGGLVSDIAYVREVDKNAAVTSTVYFLDTLGLKVQHHYRVNLMQTGPDTLILQLATSYPGFPDMNKMNLHRVSAHFSDGTIQRSPKGSQNIYATETSANHAKLNLISVGNDRFIVSDYYGRGFHTVDLRTGVTQSSKWDELHHIQDITPEGNEVLFSIGNNPSASFSGFQGWYLYSLTDQKGKSVDLRTLFPNVSVKKVIRTKQNQFHVFGNLFHEGRNYICFLRFNEHGELIKMKQ